MEKSNLNPNDKRFAKYSERYTRPRPHFIEGGNFVDDLSFSYYFHAHPANQALHIGTNIVLIATLVEFLMMLGVFVFGSPRVGLLVSLAFALYYNGWHCYYNFYVGAVYSTYFAIVILFLYNVVLPVTELWHLPIWMIVFVAAGSFLVVGHILFEGRLPAFRIGEAIYTTPHLLILCVMWSYGYWPELKQDVFDMKDRWAVYSNLNTVKDNKQQ